MKIELTPEQAREVLEEAIDRANESEHIMRKTALRLFRRNNNVDIVDVLHAVVTQVAKDTLIKRADLLEMLK